ncbi:MAG TPA: calcium-binding protein, partial [Allosphingosinicella sp.]
MFETVSGEAYAPVADFQLSADAVESQSAVAFARLGDGGFVAVWSDSRFGNGSMRMQRFDLNGAKVGPEINIGAGSGAALATTPSGGFLLIRTVEAAYPTSFEVRGQFYDSSLNPVGAEFGVNTRTDGFQIAESVTALAGGGYVVTWAQPENQTFDHVRAQLLDSAGNKVGGEIVVTDGGPGDKYEMGLTALAGGGFVAAWSGLEVADQYGNLSPGLRGQIFDAAGNKVGAAFALNTILPGNQANSQLAALPSGGFVAAWSDDGTRQSGFQPNGNQGIWVQLFDGAGQKIGAAVHLAADSVVVNTPIIVTTASGFLVTWRENDSAFLGGPNALRAQRFDFAGNKVAEEFTVGSAAPAEHVQMAGLALDSGAILLGWTHRAASGSSGDDVRAQLLFPVVHGTEAEDSFAGTASRDFFLGKGGNDVAAGAAGNDSLDGGAGDDTLDGGAGDDSMAGGLGNDIYVVDSAADSVVENAGEGTDEIRTPLASYSLLGTEVENLRAFSDVAHSFRGNGSNNVVTGARGSDVIDLRDGGEDRANGAGGNDLFVFRGALTSQDKVDGGDGRDQIVIQGNYAGGNALTLGAEVVGVESFVLVPGNDTRRGDSGTGTYSYHVTTVNENVASGEEMTFDGAKLRVGENFTFRGGAETDGSFRVVGGLGIDNFVGGSQSDVFRFNDGAFGFNDVVDGGAGPARDQLS